MYINTFKKKNYHSKSYSKKISSPSIFTKLLFKVVSGSKIKKNIVFWIFKNFLVIYLTFKFWVSRSKNGKFTLLLLHFFPSLYTERKNKKDNPPSITNILKSPLLICKITSKFSPTFWPTLDFDHEWLQFDYFNLLLNNNITVATSITTTISNMLWRNNYCNYQTFFALLLN